MLKKIYYRLPNFLKKNLNKLSFFFFNNIKDDFINNPQIGKQFGLKYLDKIKILNKLRDSISNIDSATDINIHIILLKHILSLKKNSDGFIVECGAYKGATSIVLSIAAKITGRKLIIYDSFKGLPNSEADIKKRYYPHLKVTGRYKKGMYKGTIEEVTNNLKMYGFIDVCILRPGYFKDTLPKHREKIEFLFMDVDLLSSTKECLIYLWPHLISNGYCFTDDACDMDVAKIWFNDDWWKKNLKFKSPGYIGSGCGIPISPYFSSLGYSIKSPDKKKYQQVSWLK